MTPPIKVLFINGWCRNGSTIIGNLLNEVPGIFHVGELHFLWKNAYGRGSNTRCGCGVELTQCPIWSHVLAAELPPATTPEQHAREIQQRQASLRTRHTWHVLHDRGGSADHRAHARTMARTYRAVAEATQSRVIVDSGKLPGEAALLASVEGIEPLYLHLVRDPRAVAHSWSQQKDYIHRMPASRSTAYWLGFNLASHAVARRYPERARALRYEDFTAQPEETIRSLITWCGADPSHNPVRGRVAELHGNHTVTGNPDRFRSGPTEIRAFDGTWQSELSTGAKLATLALSWPLLKHYGYPLRGAAPTDHGTERSSHGSRPQQ